MQSKRKDGGVQAVTPCNLLTKLTQHGLWRGYTVPGVAVISMVRQIKVWRYIVVM